MSFVENSEIVEFMLLVNPAFTEANINQLIVDSTYESMIAKLGEYEIIITPLSLDEEQTLKIDGLGNKFVFTPLVPIISISSLIAYDQTGTAYEFKVGNFQDTTLDTEDIDFTFNDKTGYIKLRDDKDLPIVPFPDYPNSVHITGVFGRLHSETMKLLQLLSILDMYSIVQPKDYKVGLIEEKIGKYSYKLADAAKGGNTLQDKIDSIWRSMGIDIFSMESI